MAGGELADWLRYTAPGSEEPVRGHPCGSIGPRRCASYPSRARHRAALQPRGRLGGGPDFGVFEGGQVRRLRPPGVKLRPPGTLVVPLEGPGLQPFTPGSTTTRPTLALPFWRPKPPDSSEFRSRFVRGRTWGVRRWACACVSLGRSDTGALSPKSEREESCKYGINS